MYLLIIVKQFNLSVLNTFYWSLSKNSALKTGYGKIQHDNVAQLRATVVFIFVLFTSLAEILYNKIT